MQLAILGGGVMGEVFARSVTKDVFAPHDVWVLDRNPDKLVRLCAEAGVHAARDIDDVLDAPIVLLSIKPDNVAEVLAPFAAAGKSPLLISIVAGVSLEGLARTMPENTPIIRVMTNTPCLIGEGMSALASNRHVTPEQQAQAEAIFSAVGQTLLVPEKYMDAVTGLSGSGPGFFFIVVDAMIEAGVLQGLPRAMARQLVLQTMKGSALLMQESNRHPAELRDMVTSPGGTTIAGIQVMEEYKIRATLLKTVETATRRSQALGARLN